MPDGQEQENTYIVVLNDEEQFSIWWTDREIPPGWREEGFTGSREECLAHIDEVWVDMRPLSLRRRMEARTASGRNTADAESGRAS